MSCGASPTAVATFRLASSPTLAGSPMSNTNTCRLGDDASAALTANQADFSNSVMKTHLYLSAYPAKPEMTSNNKGSTL